MPGATTLPRRQLISQQAAAEYLGVTDRTVRNMIRRGELKAFRLGGRLVRVDRADLDALLRPIPTAGGHREAS